jgi:phosphoserine aminotransferase
MPDTAILNDTRPAARPANPDFSSGPCAKRPGWSLAALEGAWLGRSHRAAGPKARIVEVIARSRAVLGMPADWVLGVVPGSDTGAIEMALWSMLGARPVDILAFETFSKTWANDVVKQLRLADARVLEAPYGRLPDLGAIAPSHDLVLAWNGTTSGVRMPGGDFIHADRAGLVFCDATSAAFAMRLPWDKLDVVTWSWQKVLGGEAGHGMLALSPRAVARLESYSPPWPLPKVFRLTAAAS